MKRCEYNSFSTLSLLVFPLPRLMECDFSHSPYLFTSPMSIFSYNSFSLDIHYAACVCVSFNFGIVIDIRATWINCMCRKRNRKMESKMPAKIVDWCCCNNLLALYLFRTFVVLHKYYAVWWAYIFHQLSACLSAFAVAFGICLVIGNSFYRL